MVHLREMLPHLSLARCMILTQSGARDVANSVTVYQNFLMSEHLETIDSVLTLSNVWLKTNHGKKMTFHLIVTLLVLELILSSVH